MIKVGLCGTIGSGKSTVCRMFEQRGVAVYIADDRAKELMCSDENLKGKIAATFGGGGHKKAAGASGLKKLPEFLKNKL